MHFLMCQATLRIRLASVYAGCRLYKKRLPIGWFVFTNKPATAFTDQTFCTGVWGFEKHKTAISAQIGTYSGFAALMK
jgi:hypothetical protein